MAELVYPHKKHPEPGTIQELAPGIFWLTMPLGGSLNHINLYLLEAEEGWWIVDTGLGTNQTQTLWKKLFAGPMADKPVVGVICTHMHPDHTGQAAWITDHFKCPLYMTHGEYYQARSFSVPRKDRPDSWRFKEFYTRAGLAKRTLDLIDQAWKAPASDKEQFTMPPMPMGFRRLTDGDTLTIGNYEWRIVVGSGHSPEHACLFNNHHKILISGDQVLPIITSNVSVQPSEPEANPLKAWLESLDKLLNLPSETFVLPAHNLPFYGLRDRLRDLISHHEDRMLAVEEHCIEPALATELLPVLFARKLDGRQTMMALGEAIAHIHLLIYRNCLERTLDQDGRYRFLSIAPDLGRRAHPLDHDAPSDEPLQV